MTLLEECIRFLVTAGGGLVSTIEGKVKLQDYLVEVLLLPPDTWADVLTPTICQHVLLSHLQSLYVSLDEREHGSVEDNVLRQFTLDLTPALSDCLRAALPSLHVSELAATLKQFMAEQLTKDCWSPTHELKKYLGYFDAELADEDWFEAFFPHDLQLAHATATYILLQSFA
eukprot:NODE_2127_length_1272_cov_31.496943_g2022_i0.p1 GENE.NODE_2127_length_1272_cov_31.496943_g2022_i0~~NODE_2127_length_1272_cov_31.496943_g2022_i0.p1  ORF type:complete len:172 (-),score=47.64 NODE_2127_length_1272_cov_31.496943_g2022_i0:62-577(-)